MLKISKKEGAISFSLIIFSIPLPKVVPTKSIGNIPKKVPKT